MSKQRDYNDPKMFEPLDEEEAEIMASRERGEWVSASPEEFERRKAQHELYARNTLKKSERVTIRLTKADLAGIKIMAAKEGIGYQTLISSLIHKYVTGQIVSS
ncbi:MAG: antitoxin [bacterium]|nr:antitoxin [bacterium]